MQMHMSNPLAPDTKVNQTVAYRICVEGQLDSRWTEWFGGMTIAPQDNGETLLTGAVIDQAALFGLLKQVRDLGMTLISLNRVNPETADEPTMKEASKGTT